MASLTLFAYLGEFALLAPDEGRNAEVAREMSENGSWLVPTYDGLVYLDKPAFFFKCVALAFSALGVNELAARLPSALFAVGLLVAAHGFARREYGRRTADLAVTVLATTPLFIVFARLVIFDMALAFFVCTSIFSGYRAETGPEGERRRWHLLAVVMGSLATLVKGPVGFIIPLLVLTAFCRLEGRRGAVARLFAPSHLLVFLAIVGPWFFGLVWQHPDFAYYGLVKESLSRFGTAEFKRTQPFYFYAIIVATCVFPWSLLLPEAAWRAWKRRRDWSSADRLLVVWCVLVILFFSLSQSKLPGYILSAVVALGLLLARVLNASSPEGLVLLRRSAMVLALGLISGAALLLQPKGPEGVLARLAKLPSEQWAQLQPLLQSVGYSLAALALMVTCALVARRRTWMLGAFAAVPLAVLLLNADLFQRILENRSTRGLAQAIGALDPEVEVACLHCLPPGLPFYLQRRVTVATDDAREFTSNFVLYQLRESRLASRQIVPLNEVRGWLKRSPHPVYLLADVLGKPELEQIARKRGAQVLQLNDRYWGSLLPAGKALAGN